MRLFEKATHVAGIMAALSSHDKIVNVHVVRVRTVYNHVYITYVNTDTNRLWHKRYQ